MGLIKGLFSAATGFLSGFKTTLIAVGITAIVCGGAGWYYGDTHAQKIAATASATVTAGAVGHGAKVQAAQLDSDAKKNTADSGKRSTANVKRDAAANAIHTSLPALVPPQAETCPPISSDAMDKLNDPDLIGKDAQ